MLGKKELRQRALLPGLIVLCVVAILAGGARYIGILRENLQENAIQNVLNVTRHQQQAFDSFVYADQERLHSCAEYLSGCGSDPGEISRQLAMLREKDAIYSVMCLEEGWFCSSASNDVRRVAPESLEYYRGLSGSGVRDSFIGIFSGRPKFAYYEAFRFADGHRALIQKTYERNEVSATFSLSLYDGQGYGYILDQGGDILLRAVDAAGDKAYDNVFSALSDTHSAQADIAALAGAMRRQEPGSIIFSGDGGEFVYAYSPIENVDGWYLLSIVPMDAIQVEVDRILQNTRMVMGLLAALLVICVVTLLLFRRNRQVIEEKDREVEYQTRMFEVFTSYLSSNTDDMYMMFDHETERLEYVSPNAERVLGVKEEDLVRYFWESDFRMGIEETKDYYAKIQRLRPGETASVRNTERVNPKTGEHLFFRESAYCADIQGRTKRVAYFSDRTTEQKIQASLTEALQMARAANDAKSAFLGNVSHDIRTPMNAITGFLALMRDEADNPAVVREYTQRIDAASQHLLGLINDVLDMNKIESGSATLNISEMNLAEVIDEINTIIRPQAKKKNQAFDIFASHLAHEHLLGDKLRLNQILINLLSNAVKYTPEGGTIEMRVEELPQVLDNYSRVRFTVRDNGVGMSEEYLKVIFDPFTREETKATHEIQGTGLGMAISKSLVDLMGGTISVESRQGEGSTFTVELELRMQEASEVEQDPGFWDEHKVTKMIVTDDEEEVCLNIVRAMSKSGVSVDYATSGEAAIRMMREAREAGAPYDVILLDWKMPDLNGLETARLIRKNYPVKIPILLLTAYDWSEIEQEAKEIGVDHFMPKPFFLSTFKDAIRRVMGRQKKEEASQTDIVRGKHILVVDDIEVNRMILVKILGNLGAECDTAADGQEAVEKFELSPYGEYDLILMDVQMPRLDGYAATRAIRSSGHAAAQTIPIIAMTANAFVDDVRNAIESGMDAHIAKPIQMESLKATIRQVLDRRAEGKK